MDIRMGIKCNVLWHDTSCYNVAVSHDDTLTTRKLIFQQVTFGVFRCVPFCNMLFLWNFCESDKRKTFLSYTKRKFSIIAIDIGHSLSCIKKNVFSILTLT